MAIAAGDSGQGDADAGRQPARGSVADDDFHDVEPGRRGNHRVDDRRDGICAAACGRRPRLGLDEKVERTASEAAKRKFAPEFMNRIDKVVVFHPLRSEQLEADSGNRAGNGAAARAGDGARDDSCSA